jgi:Putative Ig domain
VAILYDDDFQSYSIGQNQPYGLLVKGNIVNSVIEASASPSLFGDAKAVSIPTLAQSLVYPTDDPDPLFIPFYSSGTVTWGINLINTTIDLQSTLLQFISAGDINTGGWLQPLLTLRLLSDGTLAFTTANFLNIFAVSDFALLTEQWYWFQVDANFFVNAGNVFYSAIVSVNGQVVLSITNQDTFLSLSDVHNFPQWDLIGFGGGGQGSHIGRVTIYDSQQSLNTYAHGGDPVARVSSMVIELIRPAGASTPSATCPVGGGTATVGVPYGPLSIDVTGGIPPYTFAIVSGALPPGITLSIDGVLSGTPTALGTYDYTAQVTDSNGLMTTVTCEIVVTNVVPPPPPFCIVPPSPTFESTLVTYTEPTELEGS